MNIHPLHEYVVVRPEDPPVSAGGIIIPEAYREDTANRRDYIREHNRFCAGIVVTIGRGRKLSATKREPIDLEVGQRVYYKRAEARDVPDDAGLEQGLVLVRQDSIAFQLEES